MTYNRLYFTGAAVANSLSAPIGATDTTIPLSSALSGWPISFPFPAVLDKGTSNEEQIEITAGTSSLTVVRGRNGTAGVPHSTGATLQHCVDAGVLNNHEAFLAGNGTVTPSTSAAGDVAADGTSAYPAAADHKHAREAFGVGASTASAPGDSAADGTSTSLARADHKHGREAWGVLADVTASAPGDSTSAGSSTHVARADHKHGREAAKAAPVGGQLGSNYTVTSSFGNFLTTASLGVGTWLITMSAFVNVTGGAATVEVEASLVLPAVATFAGCTATQVSATDSSAVLTFLATVTTAGSIGFGAKYNGASGETIEELTTSLVAYATGYTAVQVA